MARKTTTTTPAKATSKGKADPYANVKDDGAESSAQIVFGLMSSEADYETRVLTQGPILAKRIAAGEKNADIARGLVALLVDAGKVVVKTAADEKRAQNTAAQKVSRYARIGDAILKAQKDPKADLQNAIAKASAKVRNSGPKASPKTPEEKVAILLDSLVKVIAKADRKALESLDTALTTVVLDAVAKRYAELDTAAKVA